MHVLRQCKHVFHWIIRSFPVLNNLIHCRPKLLYTLLTETNKQKQPSEQALCICDSVIGATLSSLHHPQRRVAATIPTLTDLVLLLHSFSRGNSFSDLVCCSLGASLFTPMLRCFWFGASNTALLLPMPIVFESYRWWNYFKIASKGLFMVIKSVFLSSCHFINKARLNRYGVVWTVSVAHWSKDDSAPTQKRVERVTTVMTHFAICMAEWLMWAGWIWPNVIVKKFKTGITAGKKFG